MEGVEQPLAQIWERGQVEAGQRLRGDLAEAALGQVGRVGLVAVSDRPYLYIILPGNEKF